MKPSLRRKGVIQFVVGWDFSIDGGLSPGNDGREPPHGLLAACIHGEIAFLVIFAPVHRVGVQYGW